MVQDKKQSCCTYKVKLLSAAAILIALSLGGVGLYYGLKKTEKLSMTVRYLSRHSESNQIR